MNANTIRLTEQRDEAQSTVSSLETDVRLLRADNARLREALGRIEHDLGVVETCGMCAEGGLHKCPYCESRNLLHETLADARAALAGKDGRA